MAKKKHPSRKNRHPAQTGSVRYPLATMAFYGPDNTKATKVAVGIILKAGSAAAFLERWFSDTVDVRKDLQIARQIEAFIRSHNVAQVTVTDRIIGCPHEEGIDYPEGQVCPRCPYWEGRDRWTGLMVN